MCVIYDYVELGVIFIDRINQMNNLVYVEIIVVINFCGEQFLLFYGVCLLGLVNFVCLVMDLFIFQVCMDMDVLDDLVWVVVWMMDNIVDVLCFLLFQQVCEVQVKCCIGLGVIGFVDVLMMLGLCYGVVDVVQVMCDWMWVIVYLVYWFLVGIVQEKGVFFLFDVDCFLVLGFMVWMDGDLCVVIVVYGICNVLLISIVLIGMISFYVGNVSFGIELVFFFVYCCKVL